LGGAIMIRHIAAALDPRWRFRSAVTGHFVSRWYAITHPRSTVRERAL
jgi:hypothetical protein